MTKEQWEEQQNSLKKKYIYVPTGKPGEVKMIEENEKYEKPVYNENLENNIIRKDMISKLSPSGYTPAGRKIHPTSEDQKANLLRLKK
jgi:hypothetical protein